MGRPSRKWPTWPSNPLATKSERRRVMKNVIAIGVATVLGCMTGTALAQVVDEGGPGPEGQQYVVPSQRIQSVPVPSNPIYARAKFIDAA